MSTLLRALKKAEKDRREKLQATATSAAPSSPQQLSLPVDDAVPLAKAAPAGERPHINPLLIPAPVKPAAPRYGGAAVVVAVSAVVVLAANVLYRPAPPAAAPAPLLAAAPAAVVAPGVRLTLDNVTIPRTLLGAGPDPLQLQLDRRAELRLARHAGAAR